MFKARRRIDLLVAILSLCMGAASCRSTEERKVTYWLRTLQEGSDTDKERAAERLAELKVEEAIPILLRQHSTQELSADDLLVYWARLAIDRSAERPFTVQALLRMGPMAIPHLRRALTEESEAVRVHAAFTLGEFGPTAKEAVTDLQSAIAAIEADDRPGVAFVFVATFAIQNLDPDASIPAVSRHLWTEISLNPEYFGPAATQTGRFD